MAEQILKWFLKKATAMGCETEKGMEQVAVRCRLTDTRLELSHNERGFRLEELLDLLYDMRAVWQTSPFYGSGITISSYLEEGGLYKRFSMNAEGLETGREEGIFMFLEKAKREVLEAVAEEKPEEAFDDSAFHTEIRLELGSENYYKQAKALCEVLRYQVPFVLLTMPQIQFVEMVWDTFERKESMVCKRGTVQERKNGLKEMDVFQGESSRTLLYETVGEDKNRIVVACELADNRILPMQSAMFGEILFPVLVERLDGIWSKQGSLC